MIQNLTSNQRKVLDYFVTNPGSEIHVRGLTEEVDISYTSVRRALKQLEEKGFLEKDEKSKMTFYTTSDGEFRKVKKIINLDRLENSSIADYLDEELRPEAIVLFGSYLEGQDKEESDIDLAVIGSRDKELDLSSFEEELGREIQITRVKNIWDETAEFKNTLANGMTLKGYLQVVQ